MEDKMTQMWHSMPQLFQNGQFSIKTDKVYKHWYYDPEVNHIVFWNPDDVEENGPFGSELIQHTWPVDKCTLVAKQIEDLTSNQKKLLNWIDRSYKKQPTTDLAYMRMQFLLSNGVYPFDTQHFNRPLLIKHKH